MPYDNDPDMKVLRSLVERFDTSLTKIVDVTNEISKLLAVHDQRISSVESTQKENNAEARKVETRIFDRVDALLKRMEEHDKAVTEKINRLSEENDKRVVNLYEKVLHNMTEANNSFYDRMESAHKTIDKRIEEINASRQREIDNLALKTNNLVDQVDKLKSKSWILAGGVGVLVFIITNFGIISKAFGG
jgi:DNA anti-recombination protein RmuC